MTIQTTSLGTGEGVEYQDGSGGYVVFTITSSNYTSTHKVHVPPFGGSGSGVYNAPPAGAEANISQTMQNLMALLAPCYDNTALGAAVAVYQVQADGITTQPYPYTFAGATFFNAGTAAGAADPPWNVLTYAGTGTDGSRWQLHLPGMAATIASLTGRFQCGAGGVALNDVCRYLGGVTNGPVVASKTAIVTHSGVPLQNPPFRLYATNKRLRRRFRVA